MFLDVTFSRCTIRLFSLSLQEYKNTAAKQLLSVAASCGSHDQKLLLNGTSNKRAVVHPSCSVPVYSVSRWSHFCSSLVCAPFLDFVCYYTRKRLKNQCRISINCTFQSFFFPVKAMMLPWWSVCFTLELKKHSASVRRGAWKQIKLWFLSRRSSWKPSACPCQRSHIPPSVILKPF